MHSEVVTDLWLALLYEHCENIYSMHMHYECYYYEKHG